MNEVFVDGGLYHIAWINKSARKYKIVEIPLCTNNVAEYLAILQALKDNTGDLHIYSDSKLAVNQCNGSWLVHDADLAQLRDKVRKQIVDRRVAFTWLPREQNLAGILLEDLKEGLTVEKFECLFQLEKAH